ncbi:prolipoprotein diacylglyceryl transferase [Phaeobacter gallaeciensis]|uniref:prolipoprotein diacylglyceryl transferase n=1 Tax=Phaeobacter gallaeciensis TaxID=60890 RepID=UPI00237F738D|nr:prolipoprotein diacylglyceryl transferase [Phaeobacter gallaeciensis]MDE4305270.1 prolipoprotein diacylglyceryl transferase [Phaeobacter gallaeciensis]MDE4309618.1 prolipoprotein diacylglyceryl transferase [Phaeobacter gallaeciensis]MDE4314059.1 prolipoprotein diacylglyceryl transferase [Phaeobacter gallaeciensis]MDE4318547.1 prolipoprotein diacylglyceryl transferase [Phaeobacter gallaeciensis]MDE4322693.1 prolipoprotein diacylglyceryl transferase [Phaeobacter gallaeciensis]
MHAMIQFPDLSPEIFSITIGSFEFALRWYALAYIVGILIAWRLAVTALRQPALWPASQPPMRPQQVEDLLTWIIIGVILGGRLGFVLFYQPGYYLSNPAAILRIWEGGMAFHGGLIGVVLAAWFFALRHGVPRLQMADLVAVSVPPGLMLGRLANFINAELWGRPTDLPWGVAFPGQAAQDCGQALGEICARHPSQLYEALLEGALLATLLLWMVWRRRAFHRPGLVLGLFLAGYGMARFLVEFARQPDAQFVTPGNPLGLAWHVGGYGLTMGQLLSLPMIALGLVFAIAALRRQRITA